MEAAATHAGVSPLAMEDRNMHSMLHITRPRFTRPILPGSALLSCICPPLPRPPLQVTRRLGGAMQPLTPQLIRVRCAALCSAAPCLAVLCCL